MRRAAAWSYTRTSIERCGRRLPAPELSLALTVPGYGREFLYPSGPTRAAEIGDDWALLRPYYATNGAWCRRAVEASVR